jgi:hypothetical protein
MIDVLYIEKTDLNYLDIIAFIATLAFLMSFLFFILTSCTNPGYVEKKLDIVRVLD